MDIREYYRVFELSRVKNYALAENGLGFVVPGIKPKASLSMPEPIRYVALLQFVRDELRANHYHKHKSEYLVVLDGILRVDLTLVKQPSYTARVDVAAGSVICISPYCHHLVTAIGNDATALELSPQALDLQDSYTIEL